MVIRRFEDIQAWQKARELTNAVYRFSNKSDFSKDFRFRDQIRSAAVSVMANIAEGYDTDSDADFIRFLSYARRSVTEVQSHLYVALDQGYITQQQFNELFELATSTRNLISGFIRYLRQS